MMECECRRELDGSEYTCERCEERQDFERFTETFALLHRLLAENHDIEDGGGPREHPHQRPNWAMRCTRLLEEIEDEFLTASGLKAAVGGQEDVQRGSVT